MASSAAVSFWASLGPEATTQSGFKQEHCCKRTSSYWALAWLKQQKRRAERYAECEVHGALLQTAPSLQTAALCLELAK